MFWDGIAAFATGVLSGWGIGGGSLLMVYLTAVKNIPQLTAAGINLLYFLPAAAGSLFWHVKNKKVDGDAFWPAVAAGLIGGGVCAWLAHSTDTGLVRKLFGVLLCYIGVSELFKKSK